MDNALLFWHDACTSRLVPKGYPWQICAMQHCSHLATQPSISNKIEGCKELQNSFPDGLLDPDEFGAGASLATMAWPPMKIHLCPNSMPFTQHTLNSVPLARQTDAKSMLDKMVQQGIDETVG